MTSTQRLRALVEGKPADRIPNAGWVHVPLVDRNPKDFAKATAMMTEYYGWDLIKVMSNSYYFTEDYGIDIKFSQDEAIWWGEIKHWPVNHANDFLKLKVADPKKPGSALAREIESVKRMVELTKGEVPVLATFFSPIGWVRELSGGAKRPDIARAMIKNNPKEVAKGLEVIAESSILLAQEYAKAGASGVFFALQMCDEQDMNHDEFKEFCIKYDHQVLEEINKVMWFNMSHIHSDRNCYLDDCLAYPVQAHNYGDVCRDPDFTPISIADLRAKTDKILIGGYDQRRVFYTPDNDRELVKKRLYDSLVSAIEQNGGENNFIFGPDCALPMEVGKYLFTLPLEVLDDYYANKK